MKLGIISDVHSNIDALETAFKEFEKEKVDKIICAGDVIGIGPYPEKCVDFLMKHQDMFLVFVRGNHEGYLLKGIPKTNHNAKNGRPLTAEETSMHTWNHKRLNNEQIEFIKTWEERAVLEVEGKKIVVEHYPINSRTKKFKRFHKVPTYEQINKAFENKSSDVYIFGHTHIDVFYDEDGMYINPGSLGCPIKNGCANFGILEIKDDKIKYKQCEVGYDVDKVINDIRKLNYPICEFMIKIFYKK